MSVATATKVQNAPDKSIAKKEKGLASIRSDIIFSDVIGNSPIPEMWQQRYAGYQDESRKCYAIECAEHK